MTTKSAITGPTLIVLRRMAIADAPGQGGIARACRMVRWRRNRASIRTNALVPRLMNPTALLFRAPGTADIRPAGSCRAVQTPMNPSGNAAHTPRKGHKVPA